ncbi:hypothetical protein ABZT13_38265, partial [Streptomyces sp. NPDC005538]
MPPASAARNGGSGSEADITRRLGATTHRDDHLIALAGRLPRGPAPRTSLVESAAPGWWYTAPLPDGTSVVMPMTDADLVAEHALHTPRNWWKALMATTHAHARVSHDDGSPDTLRLRIAPAATAADAGRADTTATAKHSPGTRNRSGPSTPNTCTPGRTQARKRVWGRPDSGRLRALRPAPARLRDLALHP